MALDPPFNDSASLPAQPPAVTAASRRLSGPPSDGGALLRLFYSAETTIDDIAAAVPAQAEGLDEIKTRLKDILAKVLAGGPTIPTEKFSSPSISFGRAL